MIRKGDDWQAVVTEGMGQMVPRAWVKGMIFFWGFFYNFIFTFGYAGSLLLPRLFSSCDKQALVSSCGMQVSHCSGFSMQSGGSGVVVLGLSCCTACGIFLDQGSSPCPLDWQVDSQPLNHQGILRTFLFNNTCYNYILLQSIKKTTKLGWVLVQFSLCLLCLVLK